jgi:hypothetical protein
VNGNRAIGKAPRTKKERNEMNSEAFERKRMRQKLFYAVAILLSVGLIFQFCVRYQYIHTAGQAIWRIDRLTGNSCRVEDCNYYWSLGPR